LQDLISDPFVSRVGHLELVVLGAGDCDRWLLVFDVQLQLMMPSQSQERCIKEEALSCLDWPPRSHKMSFYGFCGARRD